MNAGPDAEGKYQMPDQDNKRPGKPARYAVYDDADLTALAVVREAVAESFTDENCGPAVLEVMRLYLEKYRTDEHGGGAVPALVIALGRLTGALSLVVVEKRLGRFPSQDEMLAELDRYELWMLEQQQDPDDPMCQQEADDGNDENETP